MTALMARCSRDGFVRWAFATALSRLDRHGRTDMSSAQSARSERNSASRSKPPAVGTKSRLPWTVLATTRAIPSQRSEAAATNGLHFGSIPYGNRMDEKYLLYIDVLGFSDLVLRHGGVDDLYRQIDELHVHRHHAFKAIAFSDTLLVYNEIDPADDSARRYLVMFMSEFAQDLLYRLIGRDLYFRAYLTKGEFDHKHLADLQSFYGEALIRAYQHERRSSTQAKYLRTMTTMPKAATCTSCECWSMRGCRAGSKGSTVRIGSLGSFCGTLRAFSHFPLSPWPLPKYARSWRVRLGVLSGSVTAAQLGRRKIAARPSAWNLVRCNTFRRRNFQGSANCAL